MLPGLLVTRIEGGGVTTNATAARVPHSGACVGFSVKLWGPHTSGLLSFACPPETPTELTDTIG